MRCLLWASLWLLPACAPRLAARVAEAPLVVAADPRSTEPAPTNSETKPTVPGALGAEQLSIFFGSPEDDVPVSRGGMAPEFANGHFVLGNEDDLHLFHPVIEGLGGAYVGVGSDQAYLFTDWARVELAWLIDYDSWVLDVHELYRLFFLHAEHPEAFLELWSVSEREVALRIIVSNHEGNRALQLRRLYVEASASIHGRLEEVEQTMTEAGVPCYLSNQDSYDFIRRLLQQRRVRPMLVNLLDDEGMVGVAASAEALGVPINVLYLSNAEEYWEVYTERYRANVASLPFGDGAMLLRTLGTVDYSAQRTDNYLRWLEASFIGNVYQIVRRRPRGVNIDPELIEVTSGPQDSPAGHRHRASLAEDLDDGSDGSEVVSH